MQSMNKTESQRMQIGLEIEPDLVAQFDLVAQKNRRSRAAEIRHLMERHVRANQPRRQPQEAEAA